MVKRWQPDLGLLFLTGTSELAFVCTSGVISPKSAAFRPCYPVPSTLNNCPYENLSKFSALWLNWSGCVLPAVTQNRYPLSMKSPQHTHHSEKHVVQEQSHKHHQQHQLTGLSPFLQQPLRSIQNNLEHGKGCRRLGWVGSGRVEAFSSGCLERSLDRRRSCVTFAQEREVCLVQKAHCSNANCVKDCT